MVSENISPKAMSILSSIPYILKWPNSGFMFHVQNMFSDQWRCQEWKWQPMLWRKSGCVYHRIFLFDSFAYVFLGKYKDRATLPSLSVSFIMSLKMSLVQPFCRLLWWYLTLNPLVFPIRYTWAIFLCCKVAKETSFCRYITYKYIFDGNLLYRTNQFHTSRCSFMTDLFRG